MIDYFSFIRQPILSASGCWAQTETQITQLLSTGLGAVCLKSCTLEAKSGNPQPNYYQLEHLSFNSKGLPNPGYPFFKAILLEHHLKHNHTLIFSIAFENTEILEHLLDDLNHCKLRPIFVEINLSCPNLDHDGLSGYNLIVIKKILMLLNIKAYQNLVIGFKCPPYLDKVMIHKMSLLINRYQSIQFITISNSIPNTICFHQGEVALSTTFGGMSGTFNKYINLGVISLFRTYLKQKTFKLFGCGGISNLNDVLEYFHCGANFVQLASCFYEEEKNSLDDKKIEHVLRQYLNTFKSSVKPNSSDN